MRVKVQSNIELSSGSNGSAVFPKTQKDVGNVNALLADE
jgi:hypothetical protein